mgnify:CR=1 FL=1
MAKSFTYLSPGIDLREVDDSFLPTQRDAEGPIIIGRTRKGPANKPIKIRNLDDFVKVFGAPVPGGSAELGDIWREGNTTGPTYASYAAQAWLASEESAVTIVRVAGEEHPSAAATGKAGWKLSGSLDTVVEDNSAAYGLFLVNSASADLGTGSLGAIIYCNKGYVVLSGTGARAATGSVDQVGGFIKSSAANAGFTLKIYNESGTLVETPTFNFSRNSSNYIRNVLNTNPQLVNSSVIDSADLKTYWLGESFVRDVEDAGVTTSAAAGGVYGVLLPLRSGSVDWSDRQQSAQYAKSGWVFAQQTYSQTKLFRLKAHSVGTEVQRNYMIAIEDIREPSNPNVDAYGSFTVCIKNMQGQSIEKFTNLNLNPFSPNYIATVIGDKYLEWDNTNRKYIEYGDSTGGSDIIYVEMNQNIADGGGAGMLPAGFYGPVRPRGFSLVDRSVGANSLGDTDPDGTKASIVITLADSLLENDIFTVTLAGDAYRVTIGASSITSATSFTDNGAAASPRFTAAVKTGGNQTTMGNEIQVLFDSVSGYTTTDNNSGVVTITADEPGPHFNISYAETTDSANRISAATPTAGTDNDNFDGVFIASSSAVPGGAGGTQNFVVGPPAYSASFNFPSLALRGNGTQGGAADPYRVYYGIRPKLSNTSTANDPDYIDYLRGLPADTNSHIPANADYEYSFIFSLDDIVINTTNNTVTYTSGAFNGTGGTNSYSKDNSFGDLLDKNVKQFMMPMWGGTEGFDITEKEPLRNDLIGSSLSETTNYVQYTLNKAIDSVKDEELVRANLLLAPGIYKPLITNKLISTAESRQDMLAIIDIENDYVPTAESKDTAQTRRGSVASAVSSLKGRNLNSSFACCFYPWVQIVDNISGGQRVWIPPSIAGLGAMAQSQARSEIWFAPAGFNRGGLGTLGGSRGPAVIQARQRLDSNDRDLLYQENINPIATFPAEGVVIFGQKTLQAGQSALDRINVRRLLLYLKSRVNDVARNLLFDQNVESTWARFKSEVNPILSNVRARFGLTDYKLVLDETTTTADLIDANVMYAKVFIKPARAIEYIVVDFIIKRTGAEFV